MTHTVLVVTSHAAPADVVTPILAALDASGLNVKALDVGRAGSRAEATVERVVRALSGELAERKLGKAWAQDPPDAAIAFDPHSARALAAVRDGSTRPAPVLAVVPELVPSAAWGEAGADRYLAVDERAAALLGKAGVSEERILVTGPFCEAAFVAAGKSKRSALRERFALPAGERVVLIEVAGFGYELSSQVALQLSLLERAPFCLFDAGNDTDAATALRAQVPTLDLRAKLFGVTEDAPFLWRAADVIVARPSGRATARALGVGARLVALCDDPARPFDIEALEERGRGRGAKTPLLMSSALEACLREADKAFKPTEDGAGNVADVVCVVAAERETIASEKRSAEFVADTARVRDIASQAEGQERIRRAPGALEDLSSPGAAPPPAVDLNEIKQLKAKLLLRKERLQRTIAEAHASSDKWQKRRENSAKDGGDEVARHAERNADLERARMHGALAELGEIDAELARLDQAAKVKPPPAAAPRPEAAAPKRPARPPVDDMLADLKRAEGQKARQGASDIDDELARLKEQARKGKPKS